MGIVLVRVGVTGQKSRNQGEVERRVTLHSEELTFVLAIRASHRRCRDQERNIQA